MPCRPRSSARSRVGVTPWRKTRLPPSTLDAVAGGSSHAPASTRNLNGLAGATVAKPGFSMASCHVPSPCGAEMPRGVVQVLAPPAKRTGHHHPLGRDAVQRGVEDKEGRVAADGVALHALARRGRLCEGGGHEDEQQQKDEQSHGQHGKRDRQNKTRVPSRKKAPARCGSVGKTPIRSVSRRRDRTSSRTGPTWRRHAHRRRRTRRCRRRGFSRPRSRRRSGC